MGITASFRHRAIACSRPRREESTFAVVKLTFRRDAAQRGTLHTMFPVTKLINDALNRLVGDGRRELRFQPENLAGTILNPELLPE